MKLAESSVKHFSSLQIQPQLEGEIYIQMFEQIATYFYFYVL